MCEIRQGDSLEQLKLMESETVDCIVTSPPYFGLRDYGTGEWEGGDPNCDHGMPQHEFESNIPLMHENNSHVWRYNRTHCYKCGARRVDKQIGMEDTPEEYVEKMVNVFREAKRVLKPSGTLWLNIGDTYAGNCSRASFGGRAGFGTPREAVVSRVPKGLKAKDMIGIPWMLAFALRKDGWYLRQDIIWAKPNPMPESVKDRCTKSHEYIFLLTKSPKYYFDFEAIREPCSNATVRDIQARKIMDNKGHGDGTYEGVRPDLNRRRDEYVASDFKRRKRDVWEINTKPYKEAHFATFPEELVEPCILAGSPQDGLVMDIFCGSGTVGAVCMKHERDFIGIELNPEYIKIATKRIRKAKEEGVQLKIAGL